MNFNMNCENTSVNDVKLWLSELYNDDEQNLPEFEANEENLKLVSEIMFQNKEAEKDAKEVIDSEKKLAKFYKEKASEMSDVLADVFSVKDLPLEMRERIEKIADVACQMDLKEPNLTNFLLSTTIAENKKMQLLEKGMANTFCISKMMMKIKNVVETNKNLKRELEILEKTVNVQQLSASKMNESYIFMNHKAKEYKQQQKKSQKNLKTLGYDSSLNHSKLVERAKDIHDLEEKVNFTVCKLESYQSLPPSEMLTKLKIEEAKHELLSLQNEFDILLNRFT